MAVKLKDFDWQSALIGLILGSSGGSPVGMIGGGMASAAGRALSPAAAALMGGNANGKAGLNAGAAGVIAKTPVPTEAQPNPQNYLDYQVVHIPGTSQYNAGLNRGVDPLVYDQQTSAAHAAAINAYMGVPNIPEATAIQLGKVDEGALPSFWDDAKLRQNVHPTSSAISNIRITPDNRIEVQWGNSGKVYSYRGGATRAQAAKEAAGLVQSNSLGRTLAPSLRSSWRQSHYDTRFNGLGRSKY